MTPGNNELRRLLRFGTIGVASNALVYAAFLVQLQLAVPPLWAAATCYAAGVAVSYVGNRAWSFESAAPHRADLPKFLLAHGIGIVSTLVVLNVLLGWLRPELAQLLNIAVTAIVTYASLASLGFGTARTD